MQALTGRKEIGVNHVQIHNVILKQVETDVYGTRPAWKSNLNHIWAPPKFEIYPSLTLSDSVTLLVSRMTWSPLTRKKNRPRICMCTVSAISSHIGLHHVGQVRFHHILGFESYSVDTMTQKVETCCWLGPRARLTDKESSIEAVRMTVRQLN